MNRSFSRCSIRRRCVALGGPAPGRACGDGFTLIELLVVIGIIAIVAAIAILSMTTTTRGAAVQAEAERLVAALRQARALAVQTGSVYGIAFNMHEYRPGETDVTDAARYVDEWMSLGDRRVDEGSGDPPDYIPTNHTGSHWYQMFGPAPRLMGGIAQNTIPIADYYKKKDEKDENPFRAKSLRDLVNVISATWIGEPYRLPPKKVRFVALSDLDDGRGTTRSQSSSSVTFESTYPRPWFGYYKDKKWYAWGGKYRIHARTQDAVICFLPNGGAIMPEFLRNKRYYAKKEGKSGKQYPKPITGTLPNEQIRSFVQPTGQDRPPWECTWDVPEIVHFLQHTGGYHITLGPDVRSRDPGAYEDAEDVLTSLLPAYRIYISRNGGIGMFAVKRGDTPENAKKWDDIQGDCPLGWWSQNNATIKVYRSPVGKPILDVVNKPMLEEKRWWVQ